MTVDSGTAQEIASLRHTPHGYLDARDIAPLLGVHISRARALLAAAIKHHVPYITIRAYRGTKRAVKTKPFIDWYVKRP